MTDHARLNPLGQPVGEPLPDWSPPPVPPHTPLAGRYCTLAPLALEHAGDLWNAFAHDADGRNWTYLPHGPYTESDDFVCWLDEASLSADPQFYTVLVADDAAPDAQTRAVGVASYLRITPAAGTIEVGHIHFSPLLQQTPAATEAMYLMMRRAFELGYRRYEWKCDALNAPSRQAAERLGFTFEGVFRQALVMKGRNRDTAWYSCLDKEWPSLGAGFEAWLEPGNFDADGRQRASLAQLRAR